MFQFLKLFFILFGVFLYIPGNAFFEIVEVMPNTLDDKNLEYITLKNTSDISRSLSGYILADKKKEYVFLEDTFLDPGERKEFFRPETKLILNNSDEEIYLYDPEGEKIDEVMYENSTKGEFLTFEEINEDGEDMFISNEQRISGEIYISDEVSIVNAEDEEDTSGNVVLLANNTEELQIPDIIFSFQRASYVSQSGATNVYVCHNDRDECKVNFDLRDSFVDDFSESDYECDIDFGMGILTGQEGRCNPNTVVFSKGNFEVIFRVWHEDDEEIFRKESIFIRNNALIEEEITSTSLSNSFQLSPELEIAAEDKKEEFLGNIHINSPKVIVQSGLVGEGRYFHCVKTVCRINLNYEKKHKDERCFWSFADMEQSSSSTHTRCNPGHVVVSEGAHEMSLRVYEKDNENNKKITRFYVYNNKNGTMQLLSLEKGKNLGESGETENLVLQINIQGTLSKEKSLSGATLTCSGVEKCYVNLEGIISGKDNDGEYTWKLDNEIFSEKLNPNGVWIEGIGVHNIIFQAGGMQEEFQVEITILPFSSKREKSQDGVVVGEKNDPNISFTQNFLPLKYDGLRISGKAPVGSRVEIYNKGEKILSGQVDLAGKYRFVSKSFIAGSYIFDTKIILSSGEEVFFETSGEYTLLQEKRTFWFISKAKKTSVKTAKATKISSLILQASVGYNDETIEREKLGIIARILFILLICMSAIFAALHLLLPQMTLGASKVLEIYSLRYQVKHRICLLIT